MPRTGGKSAPAPHPCSLRLPEISGQGPQSASGAPVWWDHELAAVVAGLPPSHDSHRPGPGACREGGSSGESPGQEGPQPGEELGCCSMSPPSLPPDHNPPAFPFFPRLHDLSLPILLSSLLFTGAPFLSSSTSVPSYPHGSVRSLRGFILRLTPSFTLLTPASIIGLPFAIWVPTEASRRT